MYVTQALDGPYKGQYRNADGTEIATPPKTPPLNVGPITPPKFGPMTPDELKNQIYSPVAPPESGTFSTRLFYEEDSPGYVPPSPEDFDSLDDIDDSIRYNYTEQQRQMMYENETPEDSETPMDYERTMKIMKKF